MSLTKPKVAVVITGSALAVAMAGCSSSPVATTHAATASAASAAIADPVAHFHPGLPGYKISVFAIFSTNSTNFRAPDSVAVDGQNVWVGFQNASVKDGSNNALTSTIVEYTLAGAVVNKWSVPGHNDGLRVDPSTHKVWVTSNEDAAPVLEIIDPASPTPQQITLAPTTHGGGYDDLAFIGGSVYIACSNPNLDANGNNVFPAVDKITVSGASATVTPVLMANAAAMDTIAKAPVTLNLTDPDSFTTDSKGNLVLVSQGDSALITIQNPGTPQQAVTKTPVGDQLDDTVWTTSAHGRLLVTDGSSNAIYWVHVDSPAATVFTEAPNDSGVAGFVGTVDLATGFVHPVMIGFDKPTGMAYVPDGP